MHAGPERRFKPRLYANQPVSLTVFTGTKSKSFRGMLVDMTRSGVGVLVDFPIALGAVVEVRSSGGVVYGQVQHCTSASSGGFRIGIVVEEGLSGEWLVR